MISQEDRGWESFLEGSCSFTVSNSTSAIMDYPPTCRPKQVHENDFLALDFLPVCIEIVSYAPPFPKNIWANSKHLNLIGASIEEYKSYSYVMYADDVERSLWEHRYQAVQEKYRHILERSSIEHYRGGKKTAVETVYTPCQVTIGGGTFMYVMKVHWPIDTVNEREVDTTYMTSLLECSPYPLCFFTTDGHLITCNPAARQVFGKTIWLQSDIFGMGERERRGLNVADMQFSGSFRIERTERRTAYENMMDALTEDGATFEVDLPMKKQQEDGTETAWYCRVFAQRQKDPVTGEPIIMVSHQDVTNLRKVEGELGRMQMTEQTNRALMNQDSDVAGSLLTLLGEDWKFLENQQENMQAEMELDDAMEWEQRTASGITLGADNCITQSQKLKGLRLCLDKADDWDFDVFELEKEADGYPLQVLTWHVFQKHNLIEEFNLDRIKLINFLRQVCGLLRSWISISHRMAGGSWPPRKSLSQCNTCCGRGSIYALYLI
eukprot:766484-Hanusia_phi.AAC.2